MIEVHVAFSREVFGPDTSSSLTTAELAELVKGSRFIHASLSNPIRKDEMAAEMGKMRATFGKSIVAGRDLSEGTVLTETDLALKKPGDGLPISRFKEILGRRLSRAVAKDAALTEEDLV
jgi:N-acetylneuraminate synthase